MKKILYILTIATVLFSCEDLLDTKPSGELPPEEAFKDLVAINQTVLGMYSGMQTNNYYSYFMMAAPAVMGDDFQTRETGKRSQNLYLYNQTADAPGGSEQVWNQVYYVVTISNAILANIDNVDASTPEEITSKNQYKGEALAVRALAHFDGVRVFGKSFVLDNASDGIPLILTPQVPEDLPSRASVKEVYDQIVDDLEAAIPLLPTGKLNGRMNQWAAKALLARVYLYRGDDDLALSTAEEIINSSPYTLVPNAEYIDSWTQEFTAESIFEVVNTSDDNPGQRETIGYVAGPSFSENGYGAIITTQEFEDLLSSDPADVRNGFLRTDDSGNDKGYYAKYPGKTGFSVILNNIKVLRLSEVYLIAAEAAVKEGNNTKANTYLGAIMQRANPAAVVPGTVTLDDVLTERRKELALEGHRQYDALRNNITIVRKATGVDGSRHLLNAPSDITNADFNTIFPILRGEIEVNPSLDQNPGY